MDCCICDCFKNVILLYFFVKFCFAVSRVVYPYIIAKKLGLGLNLKSCGKFAVVTGATDGIGKAYCEELVKRGLSIIAISRTPSRLDAVADELRQLNGECEVRTIAIDFTTNDLNDYKRIEREIDGLEVGVLVNNVGMSYDHPEYFGEIIDGARKMQHLININCLAATQMCQIIVPSMAKRGKGVIINVTSASGLCPTPLLTVYAASKAYMQSFSRALAYEYKGKGVIVQSIAPYFVATKLSKIRNADFFKPTARSFVSEAIETVGVVNDTVGCFAHSIQAFGYSILPDCLMMMMSSYVLGDVRKRALKKMEKEAAAKSNE